MEQQNNNDQSLRTGHEAYIDGYGAPRAIIYSTVDNVPTPTSQQFYHFTKVNLQSLQAYCTALCLKCGADIFRFENEGVLQYFLRTHVDIDLDGRQITAICEGMHMHQELLDTIPATARTAIYLSISSV
jgi:hypothetical protein